MNEPQRIVLQTEMRRIAQGIIMTEDILSALFQNKIFEEHMIELIRAEKTKTDQTYKMLELLPKRGPDAFDGFIEIIQRDYPWLATSLQSRCRSEMEKYAVKSEQVDKNVFVDQIDGKKPDLDTNNHSNTDIRKKVSTFVHKRFGQSKKLAEKDKKMIVNWMTVQITDERTRLQSVTASEVSNNDKSENDSNHLKLSQLKEELFKLHLKLEPYIIPPEPDDFSNLLPDDMSFELLSDEIEQMCVNMSNLQNEIDSTLDQFDPCIRDNGLKVLVESVIVKYNKQSDQLDKEGKRNTDLINDLSDYSEQIHKLETERAKMRYQIDLMHKDLSYSRHEKFQAQEHCKRLDLLVKEQADNIETLKNKIRELQGPKPKKDPADTNRSPVRRSRQAAINRSIAFNTPLFSRRSSQFYSTTARTSPQKK